MARLRTAILISGRGTNMQALLDYCSTAEAAATISLVVSNVPDAIGLRRATEASISTAVINHKLYSDREAFEGVITETLERHDIQLICLAGFMRIVRSGTVSEAIFRYQLVGVHAISGERNAGLIAGET